jgi:hypothetical protein
VNTAVWFLHGCCCRCAFGFPTGFCIVRQNDKFISEAWLVCFPFVGIYFWEKPLTA